MGREVRKVPKDWEHPKNEAGNYKPLYEGYNEDIAEFKQMVSDKGYREAVDYMGLPDPSDYMPEWEDEKKTHIMMYEDTTEGTPISPAFKTPEDLAAWLYDNGASSFGSNTATYEQWLGLCNIGWAPSMVLTSNGLQSGVEAAGNSSEGDK